MEEFEIALAELVEMAEREKLEELAKTPYDYFEALEEDEEKKIISIGATITKTNYFTRVFPYLLSIDLSNISQVQNGQKKR